MVMLEGPHGDELVSRSWGQPPADNQPKSVLTVLPLPGNEFQQQTERVWRGCPTKNLHMRCSLADTLAEAL